MIKTIAAAALAITTLSSAFTAEADCTLSHPDIKSVKKEFENGNCLYEAEVYVDWLQGHRKVELLVPRYFESRSHTPRLVVDFHGFGDNALWYAEYERSCWGGKAFQEQNVVVAYPNGFGVPQGWNAGDYCCDSINVGTANDEKFARKTVAWVKDLFEGAYNTSDSSWRSYAAGWSNGGAMAHFLACQANDIFDGAAPSAQTFALEEPTECYGPGETPIPVFSVRGQNDTLIPFDGGTSPGTIYTNDWLSARDSRSAWFEALGCGISDTVRFRNYSNGATAVSNQLMVDIFEANGMFDGDTYCIQGEGCGQEFMQCAVPTGHNPYATTFDDGSDLCDAAWQFFGEPSANQPLN